MKFSHINPPTGPQAADSPHLEKHTFKKNKKVAFFQKNYFIFIFIICRDLIEQLYKVSASLIKKFVLFLKNHKIAFFLHFSRV